MHIVGINPFVAICVIIIIGKKSEYERTKLTEKADLHEHIISL